MHMLAGGDRRRWIALLVLLVGQMMIALDVSVVNVALPAIQSQLHFTPASLAWVVNAYLISFGGFILLGGRLGDLVGRKKVFLLGVGLFTLASALCGAAFNAESLVVARFVQGIGGALVSAVVLGIIFTLFTEHEEQSRALGYYSFVVAAGAAVGLLVGGAIAQVASWHWIFYINIPFGLAALWYGRTLVPEHKGLGLKGGMDLPGAFFLVVALLSLISGVIAAGEYGWTSGRATSWMAWGLVLLAVFIFLERRHPKPLLPFSIFRTENLLLANIAQGCVTTALLTSYFFVALYLQSVRGLSPFHTGLAFFPQTAAFSILGITLVPRALNRLGAKTALIIGAPILALGLFLFANVSISTSYWTFVLPAMLLLSLGGSLTMLPLTSLAMARVRAEDAGLASGIVNTIRQVGGAIGLAAMSSIAALISAPLIASGTGKAAALVAGYRAGFGICAVLALLAFGIAFFLKKPPQRSQTAEELFAEETEVAELV